MRSLMEEARQRGPGASKGWVAERYGRIHLGRLKYCDLRQRDC